MRYLLLYPLRIKTLAWVESLKELGLIAENPVAHSELWWQRYFILSLCVSPLLVAAVGSTSLQRTSEMNPLPVTALLERTFCVCLDFFFIFFYKFFHIFPCLSISGVSAENNFIVFVLFFG